MKFLLRCSLQMEIFLDVQRQINLLSPPYTVILMCAQPIIFYRDFTVKKYEFEESRNSHL